MELQQLKSSLESLLPNGKPVSNQLHPAGNLQVYPGSIQQYKDALFFIGRKNKVKNLYILFGADFHPSDGFQGELAPSDDSKLNLKICPLTTANRKVLQQLFDFTKSRVVGLRNSFGFGDRIGYANAGHLQALDGYDFFPILAQQSIRELTRTNRTADEVMDAAVWAVFQEGYTNGFSSDADHLKTTADIDLLVHAGFTIITFDPGEYVENNADVYNREELLKSLSDYPWEQLNDNLDQAKKRYSKKIVIDQTLSINADEMDLLRAYCKYGRSLAHVKRLYDHLKNSFPGYSSEVEISVDETDSVTSIFEHYFISNELKRMKVEYISLAPRFVGSFEKGIDYKGDLKLFAEQYKAHAAIAGYFGTYKISLHSGSDKFSVYEEIGKFKKGFTHVKTAGTSYLEALRVVAIADPNLFRGILDYSRSFYDEEKRTYLVSADIKRIKPGAEYNDDELLTLFDSLDARQILHVTYGKVLNDKDKKGNYLFKEKIKECLRDNEQTHYNILIKHFRKHMEPFK